MNVIDIIAIIPYFITLGTVIAEEEDALNLPKAPVSPQVCFFVCVLLSLRNEIGNSRITAIVVLSGLYKKRE